MLLPITLAALLLVLAQVVLAVPPTNVSFTITPNNTPQVNQSRTFTASAEDADGDIASYEWDFDYNGTFSADTSGQQVSHSYGTAGSRSVALRVTDGMTNDTTNDQVVSVQSVNVSPANQAPTAAISCTPAQINQGDPVSCSSSGSSDPDGGITEYAWRIDSGSFVVGGPTFSPTGLTPGSHTITLRVTDGPGLTATASDTVSVNGLPQAGIAVEAINPLQNQLGDPSLDQAPGTPTVGQPVAIRSTSTDPGGGITNHAWSLDADNNASTGPNGGFETPVNDFALNNGQHFAALPNGGAFGTAGTRRVRLEVTDSDQAKATAISSFRVNTPPTAAFIMSPGTPVINEEITFSSASSEPDPGDSLTYRWDLDNDGNFGEAGTATQPEERGATVKHKFATANTSPGYRVRLRVIDTGGIAHEATRNVVVQNTIPKGGFTWSPNSPLPGEAVTFSGSPSVATAGKQIQSYQWDLDYDITKDQFDVDAQGASVSHAFSTAGTKTVALKVTETGGGYAIVFDRVVVNAPPQAAFTVAPGSPFAGDTVTYSSTSVDSDGPLVKHEWDLDGDGAYDDATGPVVSASYRKSGGYNVGLRVTDSKGATAAAARRVTVQARPLLLLTGVVIEIRGELKGNLTRITRLLVRAPKGTKVTVRCKGKSCSKKAKSVKRKGKGRKKLRIKQLELLLKPRTKIIITITRPGYLGKQTTYKIRRGRSPLRTDLCLVPGAKKATQCPAP